MTYEAEIAKDVAVNFEAKKHALTQKQNGDWKVTFTVKHEDMPAILSQDLMGQRYQVVIVALNDDETPRDVPKTDKLINLGAKVRGFIGYERELLCRFLEVKNTCTNEQIYHFIKQELKQESLSKLPADYHEWKVFVAKFYDWQGKSINE